LYTYFARSEDRDLAFENEMDFQALVKRIHDTH
jgi:hypothetical protein